MDELPEDAGPPPAGGRAPGSAAQPADGDDRPTPGGPDDPPTRAWRLTFAYDGDDVRVVDRRRVRMQAPPDESALVEAADEGYWLEVRDTGDAPVYRQLLHRPIVTEYEVFSPEGLGHVAAPEVSGVFQAVVPDLVDGDAVVLHGPTDAGRGPGAARGGPPSAAEGTAPPDDRKGAPPPADAERSDAAPPDRGRTLLRARLREEEDDGGDR